MGGTRDSADGSECQSKGNVCWKPFKLQPLASLGPVGFERKCDTFSTLGISISSPGHVEAPSSRKKHVMKSQPVPGNMLT